MSGTRLYDATPNAVASDLSTHGNLVGSQTLALSGTGTITSKNVESNKTVSVGTLALGVTPNKKALASAALTREVTIAVFISIWVLVILGAVFNALTITRPVRELVRGVREISKGNF